MAMATQTWVPEEPQRLSCSAYDHLFLVTLVQIFLQRHLNIGGFFFQHVFESVLRQIPSGYVKIAIENGHRNSEFSH